MTALCELNMRKYEVVEDIDKELQEEINRIENSNNFKLSTFSYKDLIYYLKWGYNLGKLHNENEINKLKSKLKKLKSKLKRKKRK